MNKLVSLFGLLLLFFVFFTFVPKAYADAPDVYGYVMSTDGAPVVGVWVKWGDSKGNIRYTQTSDGTKLNDWGEVLAAGEYFFGSWQFVDQNGQYDTIININLDGTNCSQVDPATLPTASCDRQANKHPGACSDPEGECNTEGFGCLEDPHLFSVIPPYNTSPYASYSVINVPTVNNSASLQQIPNIIYYPGTLTGRVTNKSTGAGVGNVVLNQGYESGPNNCNIGTATTDQYGYFSFNAAYGTYFCMRGPAGGVTNFTWDSGQYECQTSGQDLGTVPCGAGTTLDQPVDNAYNFAYTPNVIPTPTTDPSAAAPRSLMINEDTARGGKSNAGYYGTSGLSLSESGGGAYNALSITQKICTNPPTCNSTDASSVGLSGVAFVSNTSSPTDLASLKAAADTPIAGSGFILLYANATATLAGKTFTHDSSPQDMNYYIYFNDGGSGDHWHGPYSTNEFYGSSKVQIRPLGGRALAPQFSVTLLQNISSHTWATYGYTFDKTANKEKTLLENACSGDNGTGTCY